MSAVIDRARPVAVPLVGGIVGHGKTAACRLVAPAGVSEVGGLWAGAGCLVCGCTPDQCVPGGGCAHPACCIDHYPLPAAAPAGITCEGAP